MKTRRFLLTFILIFITSLTAVGQIKKVAILEAVDKEGYFSYGTRLMIRCELAAAVATISGYRGCSRTDIDQVLSEHNFQRTGLVKEDQIRKLGEMSGAQYVLVPEIAKIGSNGMVITASIIDVETARYECSETIQSEINSAKLFEDCKLLAWNLILLMKHKEDVTPIPGEDQPFIKIAEMPSFLGGDINLFRNWVMSRLRYPQIAQENNISGRVFLRFVIDRDGTLTDIQELQSPHPSLLGEAIRLLKTSPKWRPGKQRDMYVRVVYTIPIDFSIKD